MVAALPTPTSDGADSDRKARTAQMVNQVQKRQLAIQKTKGTPVDHARAEALVFHLARQERDVRVTRPGVAAQVAAQVEKQPGEPLMIEAAIMQQVLDKTTRLPVDFLQAWRFAKSHRFLTAIQLFRRCPESFGQPGTQQSFVQTGPKGCVPEWQILHIQADGRIRPLCTQNAQPMLRIVNAPA